MQLREARNNIRLNFPNAIGREEDFFGRQAEIDRAVKTLLGGLNGTLCSVIVRGERKIGKTSFLRITERHAVAQSDGRVVPVRVQAYAIESSNQYATRILHEIASVTGKFPADLGITELGVTSLTEFEYSLNKLLLNEEGKLFVIIIDELDALLHGMDQKEVKNVLDLNSYLIRGNIPHFSMLLSLTLFSEEEKRSFGSPGSGMSDLIELGPLSADGTEELARQLLRPYVSFDESGIQRLYDLSGGHPYFIKLVLDVLLERHSNREVPLLVTAATLDPEFLNVVATDGRARLVLENIWDVHMVTNVQELLLLLANSREGLGRKDVSRIRLEYDVATNELQRQGYVHWTEDDRLDFRIGYLRHWFQLWPRYRFELSRLGITHLERMLDIGLELDHFLKRAYVEGHEVLLTPQEYMALALLCRRLNETVTKQELIAEVFPGLMDPTRASEAIDSLAHRLRGKLGDDIEHPRYLTTVLRHGYVLRSATFRA